jgi:protein-tyrosine phosphatase
MLRQFLVRVRDERDARLHEPRLQRAVDRLGILRSELVLFVCLGNICRSPFAARLLASRRPDLRVESAGFIGPGRPPPEAAIATAQARGIDHAAHRSTLVTSRLLEEAEAVFVFDRHNVKRLRVVSGTRTDRVFWLGDFDPVWAGKRAIADPWGRPLEEFEQTFARIARCIDRVASVIEPQEANDPASP